MTNLDKVVLAFFTIGFTVALALNSWTAVVLSIVIVSLFIVNKFLDRKIPVSKPEPTAKELADRQVEFEKEVKAELLRISTMSNLKTTVGMR